MWVIVPGSFLCCDIGLERFILTHVIEPSVFEWGLVPGKSAENSLGEVLCMLVGGNVSL